MFGVFFFVSLYMQEVLGFSPVQAGATFLPMTLLVMFVAPLAGQLSDKIGAALADERRDDAPLRLAALLRVARSRLDVLVDPAGAAPRRPRHVAGDVADDRRRDGLGAGREGRSGSAIINSLRQIGGSLGVAVMGALMATQASVNDHNPEHFIAGMQLGLHVAAGITMVAAVVAIVLVRDIAHAEHPLAVEAA